MGQSGGDGGREDVEDVKGEGDGDGVIRCIQVVRRLPERRGKGSEESRREIRLGGVRVSMWDRRS